MWSVTRGDFCTMPDQSALDWGAIDPSNGKAWSIIEPDPEAFGPANFEAGGYAASLNSNLGLGLPEGIYALRGRAKQIGAACVAMWLAPNANDYSPVWPGVTLSLALGSRYRATLSEVTHPTIHLLNNGIDEWVTHQTGQLLEGSIKYVLFRIHDGSAVVAETIIHHARAVAPRYALSIGYCYLNGAPRFFAWASAELLPILGGIIFAGGRFEGMPEFGAGTAFLSCEADPAEVCNGPTTVTFPATRYRVMYTAAEKTGIYEARQTPLPLFTADTSGVWFKESEFANNPRVGKAVASLRAHHQNFVVPVKQSGGYRDTDNTTGARTRHFLTMGDCGSHKELFPVGIPSLTDSGATDGPLFFVNTSMAYDRWNVASYLPPGMHSNLHHVSSQNRKLNKVQVYIQDANNAYRNEGVANVPVVCFPVVGSLNEYTGSTTTLDGWHVRVLCSLFRKDFVQENPVQISVDDVYFWTEFLAVVSVCIHKGTQATSLVGTWRRGFNIQSHADALFSGGYLNLGAELSKTAFGDTSRGLDYGKLWVKGIG